MKNRIVPILLCFAMLLSSVVFAVSAEGTLVFAKPLGTATSGVQKLTKTNLPTVTTQDDLTALTSNIISFGLSASDYKGSMDSATAEQLAAITDHKKNGFTMIGAKQLYNSISYAVDKTWTNSNNALNFLPDGMFYDVNGNASATNTGDAIYTNLFTFNFGETVNIDKFGYIVQNANNFPQTADIYVSNDGDKWTLVAYYDRIGLRIANADFSHLYTNISSKGLNWGGDGTPSNGSNQGDRLYVVDINDVKAQYIRIASTSYTGTITADWNSNTEKYNAGVGSYSPDYYTGADNAHKYMVGEMLIFGNKLDLVSINGIQTTQVNTATETYDARFVADVSDSVVSDTTVTELRFKVSAVYYTDDENNKTAVPAKEYAVTKVYESILAGSTPIAATEGTKFALIQITDIPINTHVTFTVIPILIYSDGSSVYGAAATVTLPLT